MALQDLHRKPPPSLREAPQTPSVIARLAPQVVAIHRIHKCSARNMLESTFTLKY